MEPKANKRRRPRGHRMKPGSNVGDPGNGPRFHAAHGWVPTEQRGKARPPRQGWRR